jgi:hypothetical protein
VPLPLLVQGLQQGGHHRVAPKKHGGMAGLKGF